MGTLNKYKFCDGEKKITSYELMGLVYSSGICQKLKLSNSTIVVLFALTYHFNAVRNDAYPSQQFISNKTGLSISSVKRAIKELLEKGLILKTRNKYGNLYKLTQRFFDEIECKDFKAQKDTCKSSILNLSCYKQNQINNNKSNINKLFTTRTKNNNGTTINEMVKHKYWKHKPSGKMYQVLPDVGNHLLIRYNKQLDYVTFTEYNFTDKLEHFSIEIDHKQIKIKETSILKPSTKELIKNITEF